MSPGRSAELPLERVDEHLRHIEAVFPFVTDNHRYKVDIDTPDDLDRFARDTGHTLRWPAVMVD